MKTITLLGAMLVFSAGQLFAQITSYPYTEGFESGPGGWVATGSASWAHGMPAGFTINSAGSGSYSWVTNLYGNYANGENGFVESPEFDFSSLTNPAIQFKIWVNTESYWDGFVMQSSIDGGASWQVVGGVEPNWYTNPVINSYPGGQPIGWDGSTMTNWTTVSHELTGLAGQSSVYLRMAFSSDGSVTYEGVGFDDINVVDITCPAPTSLVANFTAPDMLDLSWVNGGSETSWNVEYGPVGFVQGTGTSSTVGTNPVTISGIPPNMLFDVYVQASCGVGDESFWLGPVMFSSLQNDDACNAILIPVDGSTSMYTNVGATSEVGEPGPVENTVWFKSVVPPSGTLAIGTCDETFDTELQVFSIGTCGDFSSYVTLGYADYNPWGCSGWHPAGIEFCGLTPGDTIYYWVDGYFGSSGVFPLSVWDLEAEAGVGATSDVCVGDSLVLWNYLSGQSSNIGYWEYPTNPYGIANDSLFVTDNATLGGDQIYYIISNVCASDTAIVTLNVLTASSAGEDGVIAGCLNEPINLVAGLSGTVNLGGQWYDPSNNLMPNSIAMTNVPGQFNFDYITSNGVCPPDTANVILNVSPLCDFLTLEEMVLENLDAYPNPTTGVLYIANTNSEQTFGYQLMDLKGQVIASATSAILPNETIELSLSQLENGIYLVKVSNEQTQKIFRIVKN